MTVWQGHLIAASRREGGRDYPDLGFPVKLGGTTLWGPDEETLSRLIDLLRLNIEKTLSAHLTMTRAVLRKVVKGELLADEIDDKVFSAVLGLSLRTANTDTAICASINDKTFRVFLHSHNIPKWLSARENAIETLRRKKSLAVRELESSLFSARAYNTWSSAAHVLQNLSYLGIVEFVSPDTCRLVPIQ